RINGTQLYNFKHYFISCSYPSRPRLWFSFPGFQTLAVQSTTHERSGHAMSTFFIFYDLGIASGAFIWGIVISGSGFTAMYIIGAILILITAYVLYLWLSKQEKRKETKQEV